MADDNARIISLARKLCEEAGYDPDLSGSFGVPPVAHTPIGLFHYEQVYGDQKPQLWWGWTNVARKMIEYHKQQVAELALKAD